MTNNFNTDWISIQSLGQKNWKDAALSSDGTKIFAIAYNDHIYASYDRGLTWNIVANNNKWYRIVCSDDGNKIIALAGTGTSSKIFISVDSGQSWIEKITSSFYPGVSIGTNINFTGVAISNSGNTMAVISSNKLVINNPGSGSMVGGAGGDIWISKDDGETWNAVYGAGIEYLPTNVLPSTYTLWWTVIKIANDESTIIVGNQAYYNDNGRLYKIILISDEYGGVVADTITDITPNPSLSFARSWSYLEINSDASIIVATSLTDGTLWTSKTGGTSWTKCLFQPSDSSSSTLNRKAYFRGIGLANNGQKILIASSKYNTLEDSIFNSTYNMNYYGYSIAISTDSGDSWSSVGPTKVWRTMASSSDGEVAIGVTYGEFLYISGIDPNIASTPTPTQSSINQTPSPTATPTPTTTPIIFNSSSNNCLIHFTLDNLINDHNYKVNIKSYDINNISSIYPRTIEFIAKNDGIQDITFIINKLSDTIYATIYFLITNLDTGLSDSRTVVITHDNCGCKSISCSDLPHVSLPNPTVTPTNTMI